LLLSRHEGSSELANSKSAKKRIRVAERRRLRNKPHRTAARTFVKKAEAAIASGDREAAEAATRDAVSMLDRVAVKGVIHKNNAARRKSRLMAKYNALVAAAG
jgi:small subunit ribosomal protein S20